jgi:putative DNA primase/helicase
MTVDRKNLPPVTVVFPTRVMLLSNELPKITDASATIVSRMIVFRLTKSWFGREDIQLLDKLTEELPGVMWWAMEGWRKLQERGTLLQPESSADALADLEDLASPVNAFLRERCSIGPDETVPRSDLYDEYTDWCKDHGRKHVLDTAGFGRDLHAAIPTLRTTKPRVEGEFVRHYVGVGLRPVGS